MTELNGNPLLKLPETLKEEAEVSVALAKTENSKGFKFDAEQVIALNKLVGFALRGTGEILLSGKPGSGKSLIISQLISFLNNKRYQFACCAPTHKAKTNLEELSHQKCFTLHEILRLQPNIEILKLDFKKLEFIIDKKALILPKLLIIDECSMINDDMYKYLHEYLVKKKHIKIIYIGDIKQLSFVSDNEHTRGQVSKVFSIKNKIELLKVHRQKETSPILKILDKLRNTPEFGIIPDIKSSEGSIINYNSITPFVLDAAKTFKKAIANHDFNSIKIACYTNKRLETYNDVIRKVLYGKNCSEYMPGEILTAYDNMKVDVNEEVVELGFIPEELKESHSKSSKHKIYNSMDYEVIEVIDFTRPADNLFPLPLPGYLLTLKDHVYNIDFSIFILTKNMPTDTYTRLADLIDDVRYKAISIDKNTKVKSDVIERKVLWRRFFIMSDSFVSPIDLVTSDGRTIKKAGFKYGYAITCHKSQGSSYDNIFIDMSDIKKCRVPEEMRQLQYVALSRTRNNIYILN